MHIQHPIAAIIVLFALLLASTDAHAFRCGRSVVKKDMHEIEVIKACGEPTTMRRLGYALRGTYIPVRRKLSPGVSTEHFPGYGPFTQQVELTEYVFNFGPRKLMRRLLFEGGVLVRIESLDYGYREKKTK